MRIVLELVQHVKAKFHIGLQRQGVVEARKVGLATSHSAEQEQVMSANPEGHTKEIRPGREDGETHGLGGSDAPVQNNSMFVHLSRHIADHVRGRPGPCDCNWLQMRH